MVSLSHVSSYAASVLEAFFGGRALVALALYFYVIYPMPASILLRVG